MNNDLQSLLIERRKLKEDYRMAGELVKIHVKKTVSNLWSEHHTKYKSQLDELGKKINAETEKGIGKAVKANLHSKKKRRGK